MATTRRGMIQGIAAAVVGLVAGKPTVHGMKPVRGLPVKHNTLATARSECRTRVCPQCQTTGATSIVQQDDEVGDKHRYRWPCEIFWDEQGLRHIHDYGEYLMHYKCSSGHHWTEVAMEEPCWCGWPQKGPFRADYSVSVPEWS